MRSLILTGLAFVGAVCAQSSAVTSFLATEVPIAKAGMLANIGPSGSKASGAKVCNCEFCGCYKLLKHALFIHSQELSLQAPVPTPTTYSLGPVTRL